MTAAAEERAETGITLTFKILISVGLGLVTFAVSNVLQEPLKVSLGDQLMLTVLVGGVALLTQFLIDFEERLHNLEVQQQVSVNETRRIIEEGFFRISKATNLFALVEASALSTAMLTELMQHSSRIDNSRAQLIRDLARHEIERVADMLKQLNSGTEVFYDGEDREWLLGLAQNSTTSIRATSLATIDAGDHGFEGGIWKDDLGSRYLALQRDATSRGVEIRRIFVFDKAEFALDPDFITIRHLHQAAGVEVRILENSMVPDHLKSMISDFVVFDTVIGYETAPATRMDSKVKPSILTTRLVLDERRVQRLASRFDELWDVAQEIE